MTLWLLSHGKLKIQWNFALWTPHYCGHPTTVDTFLLARLVLPCALWPHLVSLVWTPRYHPWSPPHSISEKPRKPGFPESRGGGGHRSSLLWTLFVWPLAVHISEVLLYHELKICRLEMGNCFLKTVETGKLWHRSTGTPKRQWQASQCKHFRFIEVTQTFINVT